MKHLLPVPFAFSALSLLALAGCGGSSPSAKNPLAPALPTIVATEIPNTTQTATLTVSQGISSYLRFANKEATLSSWDLHLNTNGETLVGGGDSLEKGKGFAIAAEESWDKSTAFLFPPHVLPSDQYVSPLADWFKMGAPSASAPHGAVESRNEAYLLKNGSGKLYKMTILSYYTPSDGIPTSALYSVKVQALPGGEEKTFVVNGTAGGRDRSGDGGYLSLENGPLNGLKDTSAKLSTEWDVMFKGTQIALNSGKRGIGNTVASQPLTKPFGEVSASDAATATFSAHDRLKPALSPIKDLAKGLVSDTVWHVGAHDGEGVYKVQFLEAHVREGKLVALKLRYEKLGKR